MPRCHPWRGTVDDDKTQLKLSWRGFYLMRRMRRAPREAARGGFYWGECAEEEIIQPDMRRKTRLRRKLTEGWRSYYCWVNAKEGKQKLTKAWDKFIGQMRIDGDRSGGRHEDKQINVKKRRKKCKGEARSGGGTRLQSYYFYFVLFWQRWSYFQKPPDFLSIATSSENHNWMCQMD